MAVHPWQDLQTILSSFVRVATDATLYGAVTRGEPIAKSHYTTPCQVADNLISDLVAILNGNGLGKFNDVPSCAPWFTRGDDKPGTPKSRAPTETGAKRQKVGNEAESDRLKTFGSLLYNTETSGTTRLPTINVYSKKRGARTPERLCMKFMTQGYSCMTENCKFPHITNINGLPDADKTKFVDFVKKQKGLSWAPGKAPTGTT